MKVYKFIFTYNGEREKTIYVEAINYYVATSFAEKEFHKTWTGPYRTSSSNEEICQSEIGANLENIVRTDPKIFSTWADWQEFYSENPALYPHN